MASRTVETGRIKRGCGYEIAPRIQAVQHGCGLLQDLPFSLRDFLFCVAFSLEQRMDRCGDLPTFAGAIIDFLDRAVAAHAAVEKPATAVSFPSHVHLDCVLRGGRGAPTRLTSS